jgi:hypothetical protein
MICAGRSPSGLARSLNCWQKQRDQNTNDGDNQEQFNERKTVLLAWDHIRISSTGVESL